MAGLIIKKTRMRFAFGLADKSPVKNQLVEQRSVRAGERGKKIYILLITIPVIFILQNTSIRIHGAFPAIPMKDAGEERVNTQFILLPNN